MYASDAPKTKEEAQGYRYGDWAGRPNGDDFNPAHCAFEVPTGYHFRQCDKAPGHGPDGLYCKRHAKKVEEAQARLANAELEAREAERDIQDLNDTPAARLAEAAQRLGAEDQPTCPNWTDRQKERLGLNPEKVCVNSKLQPLRKGLPVCEACWWLYLQGGESEVGSLSEKAGGAT